jgi:hypothetical protein
MTKNVAKSCDNFYCDKCDYKCCKKWLYDRHLLTPKHKTSNVELQMDDAKKLFFCNCGKEYKHRQGLWKHKQKCLTNPNDNQNPNHNVNVETDKETMLKFFQTQIKESKEIRDILLEQNNKLFKICKDNSSNVTINNSNNVNSNNKIFNIQLFLNETCKDAMNIMDFVNSLQLQLSDLENVGKVGYVNGISNIIVKNLKALDISKRPVHCSDSKREVLYVKDENKWEKENEEKIKLKKAITHVANKNCKLIPEWKEKNPDCIYSHSIKSDEYNKIIVEAMGGNVDVNCNETENKIIKKIAKEIIIEKLE